MGGRWLMAALVLSGTAQARDLGSPEVVVEAAWGNAVGEVGRIDGVEASSEGPLSFAVDEGGIWILDQVNARVLRFVDGRAAGEIALPSDTFNDVAVADGRLVLLDRLVRSVVVVLDPATGRMQSHPIVGTGIPEGGGVTAMLARQDGIWLEFARIHSVRILDEQLQPCPRTIVPGRGRLAAGLDGVGGARVSVDATTIDVTAEDPIRRLVEVDEADGLVLVAYHTVLHSDAGHLIRDGIEAQVFDGSGRLRARLNSPGTLTPLEQYREIRLWNGAAYHLVFADGGVRVLRWEVAR